MTDSNNKPINPAGIDCFFEAINHIVNINRFFYYVLINLKKVPSNKYPTLCVVQKKGEKLPTLYYNPDFMIKHDFVNPETKVIEKTIVWNTDDRAKMILHEALHVCLNHCRRSFGLKDQKRAMWAANVVDNDFIFENHARYGQQPDFRVENAGLFDIAMSKGCFKTLQFEHIKNYSFEEIYEMLEDESQEDREQLEKRLANGEMMPGEHDWQEGNQGQGAEEQEAASQQQAAQIDALLKKALENSNGAPGSLPQELEAYLGAMTQKDPSWQESLTQFTQSCKLEVRTGTWKKPSKRFGYAAKGNKSDIKPNIIIGVDSSGSIFGDKTILQTFGEYLDFALDFCEQIRVVVCDTMIHENKVYIKGSDVAPRKFAGGGGTRLQPIFNVAKEYGDVDGIILLTDGYCESHIETYGIPTISLIVPGGVPVGGISHSIFFKNK